MTLLSDFQEAAGEGDLEIVKQCIEEGVDVNGKDDEDWSALMAAAANSQNDVVVTLLENGARASINDKNENGDTALHLAALSDNEVVVTLLENGANIHEKNKDNESVFELVIRKNHFDVAKISISKLLSFMSQIRDLASTGSAGSADPADFLIS